MEARPDRQSMAAEGFSHLTINFIDQASNLMQTATMSQRIQQFNERLFPLSYHQKINLNR